MKHRRLRFLSLIMGILLLLALLAACGAASSTPGATATSTTSVAATSTTSGSGGQKIIEVATDFPTSSKDESSGLPAQNGAQLAVDQANAGNALPGYTLVFDPKDDVGASGIHDPTVGEANVRSLIGDALVAGIVGPFNSNVAEAEMPVANQASIALISPANTYPCLTQEDAAAGCAGPNDLIKTLRPTGNVTYFRLATTDDHQGAVEADYLYKTLNYHSVYIIDDAETYGLGIATYFEREWKALGGVVLGHSSQSATTSYISLLTQIAAERPDVIYFGGLDSTGGISIRQQMEQIPGLSNTPFAGGDGLLTSAFANTIGAGGGGPIYASLATADASNTPTAQSFIQQYDTAFGAANLGAYSAAAYDCMNILIQSIKQAIQSGTKPPTGSGDTPDALKFRQAVITNIRNISYDGVLGHESFDANGDTTNRIISIYHLGVNTSTNLPSWLFLTATTVQ